MLKWRKLEVKYIERLASAESFDGVFDVVKKAVRDVLSLHRAGLGLILMDMPNNVGAFHYIGSNVIAVNKSLLDAVSKLAEDKVELNSYIFVVLLHEYIHSLGMTDELQVRSLVERVVRETLGEEHPTMLFATRPLDRIYPQVRQLGPGSVGERVEIVKDFDMESARYIS